MPNDVLIEQKTPIVWADSTDYAGDGGARTHQIDLTGVAAAAARQGAKADVAAAAYSGVADRRAGTFAVTARIEFAAAPTDGDVVDIYMGPSLSGTAATANPGGLTGADAAYTGTAGSTLAESLMQLDFIGSLICTNDGTTVVLQQTWVYSPSLPYVSPVVVNNGTPAFVADAVEMSITMTPLVDEIQ
jgi:hypothetical protein